MTKNILVTGNEGFIGSNFALQAKKKKYNVIGLDWKKVNWDSSDYKNYLNKVTKDIKLESVVHFGAIASTSVAVRQLLRGFNIEALQVIADFCALRNIPLVFASSAAIYGNGDNYLSPYANSKVQGEFILNNTPNLKFQTLRLFNTYGFNELQKQGMKSFISDMIISSLQNKKIFIWKFDNMESGLQSRDFIHVSDVNSIILKIIFSDKYTNQTLDLGTGKSYKFIDLARFIASIDNYITIEFTEPPVVYDKRFYQKYTCADISWLERLQIEIIPSDPYKSIPILINQYKKFLNSNIFGIDYLNHRYR